MMLGDMPVSIQVLATPNLRTSYMKVVDYLKRLSCEALFLNFPENLELLIRDLVKNRLSYRAFIEEVRERKLVPEPIEGWRYTAEPILKALAEARLRKAKLECHCYADPRYTKLSLDVSSEIATLTLRANIGREIDLEDWRSILLKGISLRRDALNKEADSIHEKAIGECSCVSNLDGENLEQRLTEKGHKTNLINVEEFYHRAPLEMLEERLAKGDISNEEAEKLVRDHLDYVKNYILTSRNRDQAYYKWVYEKVPSLREKIDSTEVRHLDVLLHPDNV